MVGGWWLVVGGWWLVVGGWWERGTGNSYQEEEADNHCNSAIVSVAVVACSSSCLLLVGGWWLVVGCREKQPPNNK